MLLLAKRGKTDKRKGDRHNRQTGQTSQTHRHTDIHGHGTHLARKRRTKRKEGKAKTRQSKTRLEKTNKHRLTLFLSSFWKRALTPAVLLVGVIVFVLCSCCVRVVLWLCCVVVVVVSCCGYGCGCGCGVVVLCCVVFSCLVAVLSCLVVCLVL
jgi:hypothetical protein